MIAKPRKRGRTMDDRLGKLGVRADFPLTPHPSGRWSKNSTRPPTTPDRKILDVVVRVSFDVGKSHGVASARNTDSLKHLRNKMHRFYYAFYLICCAIYEVYFYITK